MTRKQLRQKLADYRKAEEQSLHKIGEIRGAICVYREWLSSIDEEDQEIEKPTPIDGHP